MVAFVVDISERKRAEEQLRQADREKDRFLATLAHELRNPLAPIRSAASLLTAQAVTPDRVNWASKLIQRQVSHMAVLLDDLLDISRITAGKLTLRRATVVLAEVIERAVEAARPLMQDKGHALTVTQPGGLRIHVDPVRLGQVLTNLLTNAAKYTPSHGVVELRAAVDGRTLVLTVRDNGVGISRESMSQLFRMFSQLESDGATAYNGLGVGLALTRGIVELHGGTIAAISPGRGQGSEFRVSLPGTVVDGLDVLPLPEAGDAPPCRQMRVLIADDNVDAAEALAVLLETWGHQATVVANGEQAVSEATNNRYDVALLDIGMPVMDGYTAARCIRQANASRITLVALTGWGQRDDVERAVNAGFDVHVTKPVDPVRLRALVEAADDVSR